MSNSAIKFDESDSSLHILFTGAIGEFGDPGRDGQDGPPGLDGKKGQPADFYGDRELLRGDPGLPGFRFYNCNYFLEAN